MQKVSLTVLLAFFVSITNVAAESATFKQHTFEISFTPAFASYFFVNPNNYPGFKTSETNLDRPYAGFNMGVAYIYRPIKSFGVSVGIDQELQGIKMGFANGYTYAPNLGTSTYYTVNFKGYQYNGYLQVPVLVRAYLPVKKIELELATGPVFSVPLFNISNLSSTSNLPVYNGSIDKTASYPTSQMTRDSWLAWTIQALVNIPVKGAFSLSIGPEVRFLNIYPLHPDPEFNSLSRISDYYVGCKIAFRIGGNCNVGTKTAAIKGGTYTNTSSK